MRNSEILEESIQLISRDFLNGRSESEVIADWDQLEELLLSKIKYLLDHEFERLLNICYRIDFGEQQLADILENSPPKEMARKLTQGIIARQKQKIVLRSRYR